MSSRDRKTLREEQAAAAKKRILEAAAALLVEQHPAAMSVPSVAERAGVSVRTVYRYFSSKEALIDAVAGADGAPDWRPGIGSVGLADLSDALPKLWAQLLENRALMYAEHTTPTGADVRRRRLEARRKDTALAIEREGIELPAEDERRLADLIGLLASSKALVELVDLYQYPVEDAGRLAAWAVGAVVERAQREGGVG